MIDTIKSDRSVELIREENNPNNKNAVAVFYKEKLIGYIPEKEGKDITHEMDCGSKPKCTVFKVTGDKIPNLGVKLVVEISFKAIR